MSDKEQLHTQLVQGVMAASVSSLLVVNKSVWVGTADGSLYVWDIQVSRSRR